MTQGRVIAMVAGASLVLFLLFMVLPPVLEWTPLDHQRPLGNPVAGIKTRLEPVFSAPRATEAAVGCTGSRCLVCVNDDYDKVNCYLVRLDTGKGPVR